MKKTNRTKWYNVLIWIISYSLGLMFMYAALSKLTSYGKFVVTIGQARMLAPYAGVLAWLLPVIEVLIAVLLVFERLRVLGLYASLGLMAAFTAYIFIALHFMADIPCSCGGLLSEMKWDEHLVFNMVFTGLAGVGVVLHTVLQRPPSPGAPTTSP